MKISIASVLLLTSLAAACAAPTSDDAEQGAESADEALTASPEIKVTDASILLPAGSDIVRRTPGQTVTLHNVSSSPKRLVLFAGNVITSAADYAQATKLLLPAGGSVVLGSPAHPIAHGTTFIGFDSPALQTAKKGSFERFARFTVVVGRARNNCNVTTAAVGSDACPAWGIDRDFCTCTPAFGGGG